MKHIAVESSNIFSVGYDPTTEELQVKFRTGATYSYEGVPPVHYESMMADESKGRYFSAFIKGKYSAVKLRV